MIKFSEHIELTFDIFDFFNEKTIMTRIKKIFYIVQNFIAKTFIEMNIIESKQMKIDLEKIHIKNCDVIADLKSRSSVESKIKKIITCFIVVTIFSHFNMFVSMIIRKKFKILSNRDFIYNFFYDQRLNHKKIILFHIVNVNFSCVNVKNIRHFDFHISTLWFKINSRIRK